MINYIIQVLLFQALFLAVYDFFLQKETFFKWNRIYLLATPFLSFLIPFLKFKSFQQTVPQEYIVQLPTVFLNPQVVIEQTISNESSFNYIPIIFTSGIVLFSVLFLIRLVRILKLINSNRIIKNQDHSIVILKEKQSAFSFFNYIFINQHLIKNNELEIIKHELVHCKHKHTLDLLLFEVLKIILWFNPLIYVFQKRITLLHEYISDAEVVKQTNKKSYFNTLLSETFNVENISFINQFYKESLIKKRIAMITQNKSQKIKQLKYLLLIPLLFGMLIYSSCTDEINDELSEMENVLNQYDISEGRKYFDFEIGKTCIGSSLMISRYLTLEEYTPKEKELHEKFNNLEGSMYDYVVLIDVNDERVNWFRPKSVRLGTKSEWKYEAGKSVPFAKIEEVPVFPGCEGTEQELRQCLQENITKHVNRKFNSNLAKNLGLSPGVKRIFVMFKIDKQGNIAEVKARAPHQSLADEAIRVVNLLPQMVPGKYDDKNVGVQYSLPIAFKVSDDSEKGDSASSLPKNTSNLVNDTNKLEDFGIINLTVSNVNSAVIIQLMTEKDELITAKKISDNQLLTFRNLPPKTYIVRAIIDENNNGKLDTESSLINSHPEKVLYLDYPLKLRANWEINETFILKNQ